MTLKWYHRMLALALCAMLACSLAGAEKLEGFMVTEDEPSVDSGVASAAQIPGLDRSLLILASAQEPLTPEYVPAGLVNIISRKDDNRGHNQNGGLYMANSTAMHLVEEALNALTRMIQDAESEGVVLYIRQAYRSYEDEQQRYERMKGRAAALDVPGQSDWQTGLAVTLVGKELRTKALTVENYMASEEAQWLMTHCAGYGFVVRYPQGKDHVTGHEYEPWHLRYVGEGAAQYMAQRGLTLEELREELDNAGQPAYVRVNVVVTTPTPVVTQAPAPEVTQASTPVPTEAPTPAPTEAPTPVPTEAPTPVPTETPVPVPEIVHAEDEEITMADTGMLWEEVIYDDVVWNFPIELSDMDPELVKLANKQVLLSKDFVPDDLVKVPKGKNVDGGVRKASSAAMELTEECTQALISLMEAAEADGQKLYLKSAYRSYRTQNTMYYNRLESNNGKDDGWVSKPGASDHQTGLGCDVVPGNWTDRGMNEKMAKEEECQWMAEHCHEYGFIIRYPEDKEDITEINYEPWHLRYVGVEVATYIMENGLCLEEFHQELQAAIDQFIQDGGNPSLVEDFVQVSADND